MSSDVLVEGETGNSMEPEQDIFKPDSRTIACPVSPSSLAHHTSSSTSKHSETSTLRYNQEPWSEYSHRVEQLCEALWPSPKTCKTRIANSKVARCLRRNRFLRALVPCQRRPTIERLEGGDYNRITGITLPSSNNEPPRRLILRVPRDFELSRPDHDIFMLKYVRDHYSIPVATVVGHDFTCDNPLESPYVLQERIPGKDLEKIWPCLGHAQRCTVATDVGHVVKELLAMETPIWGTLASDDINSLRIDPFELKNSCGETVEEPEPSSPSFNDSPRQTTLQFFTTQFLRWRAVDLDENGGQPNHVVKKWDNMLKVVREMELFDHFKPDLNCLCHIDLYPRNVMAEIQTDDSVKITGVLDWDDAVFAPKFIACKPLLWLWTDESDDRTDENGMDPCPCELPGAEEKPADKAKAEMKRLFEEAAGPEYRRLAYAPQFRLCRGLFRIAMVGLTASENFRAADRIVDEWEAMRLSLS